MSAKQPAMRQSSVFNLDDALGPVNHDPEISWVMGEIGRNRQGLAE